MPPRGLPGNANLEQLKKGAKSFQRAVRAADPGAAVIVNEFHPRLASAAPGSPELDAFTRSDAQLVVARQFGFASWPKLKAHLELVERYARSPHEQPIGGPLDDEQAIVDEFLRLACLTYGDDDPARPRQARVMLAEHPWLDRASVHTIAATGAIDAARELLAADPSQASLVGGPHRWEPLLYLTYSRAGLAPGHSAVAVAVALLDHGADPNAGFLWEGLVPPFTALTGALGGGAMAHPEELALARVLLERGADPNDGQALYNRGWGPDPDDAWLKLLFEFGLGTGDGGPWRRLLGERQDSPSQMLEDLLMAAASHGLTDRVRRLVALGVSPDGRGSAHPIYEARTPVQEAALSGYLEIVTLLADAGAQWTPDPVDAVVMAAMAGQRETLEGLISADPDLREQAVERRPDQLVRAAQEGSQAAVALLLELGFDVNARPRTTALHEAAMRGDVAMIRQLLAHGADPDLRDTAYRATPAGWAEHHGHPEAQRLLEALETHSVAPHDGCDDDGDSRPGAAMRTVTAALTAVSDGRFEELEPLLADDLDWRGVRDEDGLVPRCHGRAEAIARMRVGWFARGEVGVSALVEDGDRVLAHVHSVRAEEPEPRERFVVAEVHGGQISRLCGYPTEEEAREAMDGDPD